MNVQTKPNLGAAQRCLPFERVALVLQGGGALGAYQAGVYEALAESGIHPDWIAGISIGGINAAIIAGNPPNMRVDRLREFWTQVTTDAPRHWFGWAAAKGDGTQPAESVQREPGAYAGSQRLLHGQAALAMVAAIRNARGNQLLRHP